MPITLIHYYAIILLLSTSRESGTPLVDPSMHACAQDRGHKELGVAARIKHLVYILVMQALGVWWTSDSLVR